MLTPRVDKNMTSWLSLVTQLTYTNTVEGKGLSGASSDPIFQRWSRRGEETRWLQQIVNYSCDERKEHRHGQGCSGYSRGIQRIQVGNRRGEGPDCPVAEPESQATSTAAAGPPVVADCLLKHH